MDGSKSNWSVAGTLVVGPNYQDFQTNSPWAEYSYRMEPIRGRYNEYQYALYLSSSPDR